MILVSLGELTAPSGTRLAHSFKQTSECRRVTNATRIHSLSAIRHSSITYTTYDNTHTGDHTLFSHQAQLTQTYAHVRHTHGKRHTANLHATAHIRCQPSGTAQSHVRTRTTTHTLGIKRLSAVRHSSPRRTHTYDTTRGPRDTDIQHTTVAQ